MPYKTLKSLKIPNEYNPDIPRRTPERDLENLCKKEDR